jgi:hypothetical protein
MADLMHIVALNPEEQLTVYLLFQIYLKLLTKMYMQDLADGNVSSDTCWNKFCSIFDRYQDLTESMATPYTLENSRPKLYHFNEVGIKQILKIMEVYDPAKVQNMDVEAIQVIEHNIDALHKKISLAASFSYTQEEVKRAVNGK